MIQIHRTTQSKNSHKEHLTRGHTMMLGKEHPGGVVDVDEMGRQGRGPQRGLDGRQLRAQSHHGGGGGGGGGKDAVPLLAKAAGDLFRIEEGGGGGGGRCRPPSASAADRGRASSAARSSSGSVLNPGASACQ